TDYPVVNRTERFDNRMFRLVSDDVLMPGGRVVARDYLVHVGAVGVVAIDEADRVVLIRQYRHPVGRHLWELPAGLIDVAGEPLERAALRELAEESDLTAGRLGPPVGAHPAPGRPNRVVRPVPARDPPPRPAAGRH